MSDGTDKQLESVHMTDKQIEKRLKDPMGWPIGWTALEPLETDKFREWLMRHGKDWPRAWRTTK